MGTSVSPCLDPAPPRRTLLLHEQGDHVHQLGERAAVTNRDVESHQVKILSEAFELRACADPGAFQQGLTLVAFSAQHKRFLWDRGCDLGVLRGCLGGVRGCPGCVFVSEAAHVELRSGRVSAPVFQPGDVHHERAVGFVDRRRG